jgi:hypothetical protein
VKLLWIASEDAKLRQRRTAFINGLVAITPPDDALVARVKDLTSLSEKLTNDAIGAQNAIKLTAAALAQFNTIQQPSSTCLRLRVGSKRPAGRPRFSLRSK